MKFALTVLLLPVFLLAACNPAVEPPAAKTDPYDMTKMDLKPTPATVSAERHSGPFSSGAALSLTAELQPLDPAPIKTIQLDTTHKVIEIAPGGYFRGNAEVEEADISGRFEGTLVARQKLTLRKGGRIDGSVRYGRIVIESGGEISGDMSALEDAKPAVVPVASDR